MSRNFELLQQAGKAWDVPSLESSAAPNVTPIAPPPVPPVKEKKPFISFPEPRERNREKDRVKPEPTSVAFQPMDKLAREEAYRLVQRVFFMQTEAPPRVVVFAGVDHGNGCSRICVEAAETLRSHGQGSVCLVEGNFRSPSLPDLFGTTNHNGLTNALLSGGPIRAFTKPVHAEGLWLLSAGALAPDSHGLLNSERLRMRFDELRAEFDYVIVDAPPLTRYSDAIALGRVADGLVMVLEAHSTRREAAVRVTENLRATQVNVLGVVLNKRTFPIPHRLYHSL